MEDRKLLGISQLVDLSFKIGSAYMYFFMPAGLLVGKPISWEEYLNLQNLEDGSNENQENQKEQQRFFYLKDAILIMGNKQEHFPVTIFDGLDVSGWGLYDSTHAKL